MGLVRIADDTDAFARAVDAAMAEDGGSVAWRGRVDELLADMSWDRTWARMDGAMRDALRRRARSKSG
jgi:hypothetical protein